jgi:glutaredoxin
MPKIKIYSTATCQFCKLEKAYLDSKGIAYESIMVDEDQEKAKEFVELSGQMGVPFTVIETDDGKEEHILGFNKPKIDALLGIA